MPNTSRGQFLFGFPMKAMPVADEHFSLAGLVEQARRDDVKLVIEIPFSRREQDLEAAFHGQTWGDHEMERPRI